jgi:NTP pyrophosphatase (non-canonical NTP hydrolase)
LLEIFQWLSDTESSSIDDIKLTKLKEEIGDITIYLINLADKFDIDIIEAAKDKLKINEAKYPADIVKGKSKKYNEY